MAINGKAWPPLALKRQPDVLLTHVHETGDTSRLYWAFRDFDVGSP